ncbi:MAG: phage/plasmid primase, P4 family [Chloroflexi bacterium]|nr:phage/plasmid primase, P4 family [Chloroflexota bacterium]
MSNNHLQDPWLMQALCDLCTGVPTHIDIRDLPVEWRQVCERLAEVETKNRTDLLQQLIKDRSDYDAVITGTFATRPGANLGPRPATQTAARSGTALPPPSTPEFAKTAKSTNDVLGWPLSLQLTDTGNGARFANGFHNQARYTTGRGWMVWDGKRFAEDANEISVTAFARQIAYSWYDQAKDETDDDRRKAITRHASRSLSAKSLANTVSQAGKFTETLAQATDFDRDLFLLNVQNGILDLRTGELRPHDPAVMCSRLAGVRFNENARAPRWKDFLLEIFDHDTEMTTFARRWMGYTLSGDTREQLYVIAWGGGANGKSTLFDVLRYVMGDYTVSVTPASLATHRELSNINTDIARIPGARLAICPEWNEDMRADESMLKDLTGQDHITVRTLYQKPFTFKPQAKIIIYGNHKPQLRGTDGGTWRRPLLVPFTREFKGKACDKTLGDKLKAEAEGILADLVRACMEWQRDGLAIPRCVAAATNEFRKDSNDVLAFIEACCIKDKNARALVGKLHAEYLKYGGEIKTVHKFGAALREIGYVNERTRNGYETIGLGPEAE